MNSKKAASKNNDAARPVVVLVDCTEEDRKRFDSLEEDFEVRTFYGVPESPREIVRRASGAEALVTIFTYTKLSAEVISSSPELKLIVTRTTGYTHIDVKTASEYDVAVAVVPDAPVCSTGEFVFAMLLSFVRNIGKADSAVKSGEWDYTSFLGDELSEKTLGIIGMGRIGTKVARIAKAFNMRVIAYNRTYRPTLEEALQIKFVSLEELLKESDYITVHLGLTTETRNFLNAERLDKVKENCVIVNVARGGIIDEQALYERLAKGRIRGACIDVTEPEPPQEDNPLLQLPNVIATPHIAWHTPETTTRQFEGVIRNVRDFFLGEPRNIVNREVLDRTYRSRGGQHFNT